MYPGLLLCPGLLGAEAGVSRELTTAYACQPESELQTDSPSWHQATVEPCESQLWSAANPYGAISVPAQSLLGPAPSSSRNTYRAGKERKKKNNLVGRKHCF